ncbi:hypothetical protein NPIL_122981 [Nephila pilipes]|uniref:Uncharacterized protein n=1 Tax=Nephila pilipes TaxID=299642 RepID=A0A8X6Q2V7_NEPPI|nr:hypothetical protein NPIL_122981 [Nephila pilipes]
MVTLRGEIAALSKQVERLSKDRSRNRFRRRTIEHSNMPSELFPPQSCIGIVFKMSLPVNNQNGGINKRTTRNEQNYRALHFIRSKRFHEPHRETHHQQNVHRVLDPGLAAGADHEEVPRERIDVFLGAAGLFEDVEDAEGEEEERLEGGHNLGRAVEVEEANANRHEVIRPLRGHVWEEVQTRQGLRGEMRKGLSGMRGRYVVETQERLDDVR